VFHWIIRRRSFGG